MIKQLLLATNNPGKLGEMRLGLTKLIEDGWQLVDLAELGISEEPEETGATFAENALLKAKFYSHLAKLPALSDDGGFVIPVLNNEPGVRSRRWLGYEASDEQLIEHTLAKMSPFQDEDRQAYLELVLAFYDPAKEVTLLMNEKITGHVAEAPSRQRIPGFPYRALLLVDPYQKYYDELTPVEHQQVNHRLRALSKLTKQIIDRYA